MHISILKPGMWSEIHMDRILEETKKSLFVQRQLQSHSLGDPDPHVNSSIHPRINQYYHKNAQIGRTITKSNIYSN